MLAAKALAACRTLREVSEIAHQFGRGPRGLRFFHLPQCKQAPARDLLFQTYVHDKQPEPARVASAMFPEFRRSCCDDQVVRETLRDLAGTFGTALLDQLKQPAHRADIFRYIYQFKHGGLYLDIKCGFVEPWQQVLKYMAADWSTAHASAAHRAGYNPVPVGHLR